MLPKERRSFTLSRNVSTWIDFKAKQDGISRQVI